MSHFNTFKDRNQQILKQVSEVGFVSIEALAQKFNVSSQTIRRCVNQLCEQGLLRRLYGGVDLPSLNSGNLSYQRRQILNEAAKRQIAQEVAHFIPAGASVSLGIGTTPEQVALALKHHKNLNVMTNNLNVANALAHCDNISLSVCGGSIRTIDFDIIGHEAASHFGRYKTDFAIFGVGGVDEDGTLLDFHEGEVIARQAMADNTRTTILVVDRSKFGRPAIVRGGHISRADHIFSDAPIPMPFTAALRHAEHIRLHIASTSGTLI